MLIADLLLPGFRIRPLAVLLAALAFPSVPLVAQTPPSAASITPQQQKDIDRDIAEHFGDAPQDPGPKAKLSPSLKPAAVKAAMSKVAVWEIDRAQPFFDRTWTWNVLYTGFMAASQSLAEPRYRNAMEGLGESFQWQLRSVHPNADDQSVAQTYLELDLREPTPEKIAPTRAALDDLIAGGAAAIPENQAKIPWW